MKARATLRMTRQFAARVLAAACALLSACVLSACRGVVVSASGSQPAQAPAAASTPATPPQAAGAPVTAAPASGNGSVTVSITSPVSLSGSVSTAVACVPGRAYRASVASAVVHGGQVSFGVLIPMYRGPGSYPAVVSATLRQGDGRVTTVAGVSRVAAAITSAGGSFSVTATGTAGRTFAGSLAWTCG